MLCVVCWRMLSCAKSRPSSSSSAKKRRASIYRRRREFKFCVLRRSLKTDPRGHVQLLSHVAYRGERETHADALRSRERVACILFEIHKEWLSDVSQVLALISQSSRRAKNHSRRSDGGEKTFDCFLTIDPINPKQSSVTQMLAKLRRWQQQQIQQQST